MQLIPDCAVGMDVDALPEDCQAIMRLVADATEPPRAGQVSEALGRGPVPARVEAVRAKPKRFSERGWLHRTPGGRFTLLDDTRR